MYNETWEVNRVYYLSRIAREVSKWIHIRTLADRDNLTFTMKVRYWKIEEHLKLL